MIDFLDIKTVVKYLLMFAVILIVGNYLKDYAAIVISSFIFIYLITSGLFKSFELWLMWFFTYGFYLGQEYFTIELLSKYAVKPSFLLFIIFILSYGKIPAKLKKAKYIFVWIIFLLITILSAVYHKQSPFVIITISSFFLIYLILNARVFTEHQYKKLLNLFIAAALLQTIVSLLQVSQIISPPTTLIDDGFSGKLQWSAGLDDAACGTFGAVSSHLVSWYAALIALFSFLCWAVVRKNKYLVVVCLSLMQFATVDSKIIMGVMVLMMIYLLYYLNMRRSEFRLNIRRLTFLIIAVSAMGYGLYKGWDYYYSYWSEVENVRVGKSKQDLQSVYEGTVMPSQMVVLQNLPQWGKIQGYRYVFEDYLASDVTGIIWGYGIQGYAYNGKGGYIQNKDIPIMRLSNFTNSTSALISQFAQSGLVGFIFFIISIFFWYKYNARSKGNNKIDLIWNGLLKIFLLFSLLAAFLYPITIISITLVSFSGLVAILKRLAEKHGEVTLRETL
jgi:hypothetical protein